MLNEKKLSFTAKSVVRIDQEEYEATIATFGAVLDTETKDVSFYNRYIDKDACKTYRNVVRNDQAEFEDFVYNIQESLKDA